MIAPGVMLPTVLPSSMLQYRWVRASRDFSSKRFGRFGQILEKAYHPETGKIHSVKVAYVRDHWFLEVLNAMPNVPRAVKHIYRKEVRLKHLMAAEGWDRMGDIDRADLAWAKYRRNAMDDNHLDGAKP